MGRTAGTLIGFGAVLMWSVLAALTAASGKVPPLQLMAMTFLVGGLVGLASWPFRRGAAKAALQDWRVLLLGTGALFGYHALYYSAIRNSPPIEVSLIAYLWPLLLVVFSALTPGEKLKMHHVVGVLLGLCGAVLVITRGGGAGFEGGLRLGHILALAAALLWAAYSTASRRLSSVPTDAVTIFCLMTAFLALICHLCFEATAWPQDTIQWLSVLGLGLLPVGAAFYAWDYGVKHGDILVLGAASYAGPLLSTLALVAAGFAETHWSIALACLLITCGAVIAAKDLVFRRRVEA